MKITFKQKAIIVFAVVVAACMASCNNGPGKKIKEVREKTKQATNLVKTLSNLEETAEDVESEMEKLKTLKPFDNEKFQGWMPDQLNDLKRESYQFSTAMGNTGSLRFTNEANDKSIEFTIIDGAGEIGAGLYASQSYMTGVVNDFFSESDRKLEKIVERKGSRALEKYFKEEHNSEVNAIIDKRYILFAKSKNMSIDELWEYIDKLNISTLK